MSWRRFVDTNWGQAGTRKRPVEQCSSGQYSCTSFTNKLLSKRDIFNPSMISILKICWSFNNQWLILQPIPTTHIHGGQVTMLGHVQNGIKDPHWPGDCFVFSIIYNFSTDSLLSNKTSAKFVISYCSWHQRFGNIKNARKKKYILIQKEEDIFVMVTS